MSPFYSKNSKLLISNNKLATSSDCCCPDQTWLRPQIRIGSTGDVIEQVILVSTDIYGASRQIPDTRRNANWFPNTGAGNNDFTIYPPQNTTNTFYITYDKVSRTIKYKCSHADTSGRNPPWPSAESIATVPVNKLTSETVNYPINLFVSASGKTTFAPERLNATKTSGIKIFNCNLQVVGEPVVAIPDTQTTWFRKPNWVPGDADVGPAVSVTNKLPGYKLGKGFTITGSATISWEEIRPHGSMVQAWFALLDFTNDYII